MAKIVLPDASNGNSGTQRINDNFRKVAEALNDKVLFRDNPPGEPNEMNNDLDMNSNRVYNLPIPTLDHEATPWGEVRGGVPAAKKWAEEARESALEAAESADESAASALVATEQAERAETEADRAQAAADSVAGAIGRIDALEEDVGDIQTDLVDVVHYADPELTTISARYINKEFDGVKISDFLTSNGVDVDETSAVFAAIAKAAASRRFMGVDLEGRSIDIANSMDMSIPLGTSQQGEFTIRNGRFRYIGPKKTMANFTRNLSLTIGSATATPSSMTGIVEGMYVSGPGVPRETYVRSVDTVNGQITLSTTAWRTLSSATHRFQEFDYLFDFSKITSLSNFRFEQVTFECLSNIGVFKGPKGGSTQSFTNCTFANVYKRGVIFWSSGGSNCQIDCCQAFPDLDDRQADPVDKQSVFFSIPTNDPKFRGNYFWQFGNTLVLHGSGNVIVGNHFWQATGAGSDAEPGKNTRRPSIILTSGHNKTNITGNYIDNSWIEMTNENTTNLAWPIGGGVTISGNQFTSVSREPTNAFVVLSPYTTNALVSRISVVGNVFKNVYGGGEQGSIVPYNAADGVIIPTGSGGSLDLTSFREITWHGNSYSNIVKRTQSEAILKKTIAVGSEATTVTFDFSNVLPWGGIPQRYVSVGVNNPLDAAAAPTPVSACFAATAGSTSVPVVLSSAVSGDVYATVDCNTPEVSS